MALNEFEIARDLQHPNIVSYEYFFKECIAQKYGNEHGIMYRAHILTEFCEGGDMTTYMEKYKEPSI